MAKMSFDEHIKELKELGIPVPEGVVFQYGVRIIDVDGRKALRPLTPEEYWVCLEHEKGRSLSDEEKSRDLCRLDYYGSTCQRLQCAANCYLALYGADRYCVCA